MSDLVYSVIYVILSFCVIAPPAEFVAAGLTVQNIFSSLLGSENMHFVLYHMKRTSITLIFHSLLPLGYYTVRFLLISSDHMLHYWLWQYFLLISLLLPACSSALMYYWSRNRWDNHPIATKLSYLAPNDNSGWRSVASSINIEFRRIDNFATGIQSRRLIVTESWLINVSTYTIYVAHQSDAHLNLYGSEEHKLSYDGAPGSQYLNLTVSSVRRNVASFKIRLNALEYRDLRDKLSAPVVNARNIVIQQSLSERFLVAFEEQVNQNQIYHKDQETELEPCVGCMLKPADVKLHKLCESAECVQCYCRPMWCLQCMGKWFASRQNQQTPEAWMGGMSPCPTCRSPFCVLDISHVQ